MWTNFLIWLLNKAFESKMRAKLEPCIKELYRRTASEALTLKTEVVKVKKGKRKYDLVFFETKEGRLRCNMGRHWEQDAPMEIELN